MTAAVTRAARKIRFMEDRLRKVEGFGFGGSTPVGPERVSARFRRYL
jgi:hypothetical protein